jgi:hypothetical protein
MSYHRISHSEADLSPEQKLFAANVHQFAVVPARNVLDVLADALPSNASWFDVLTAFVAGFVWFGVVITAALFFWA